MKYEHTKQHDTTRHIIYESKNNVTIFKVRVVIKTTTRNQNKKNKKKKLHILDKKNNNRQKEITKYVKSRCPNKEQERKKNKKQRTEEK